MRAGHLDRQDFYLLQALEFTRLGKRAKPAVAAQVTGSAQYRI
jgi:hypothetical protein